MPGPHFFRTAGLFTAPHFLSPEAAADLRLHMANAPAEKAGLIEGERGEYVDETVRKVESIILPKEVRSPIKRQLLAILPELEEHFRVKLGGCESPHYLIYRPGGFFKAHSDGGSSRNPFTQQRRVSIVVFLNAESAEPAAGTYGQGRLTFYSLLKGPVWERCGFDLEAETGLLIAFPSEMVHEVTPVSHGERYTVASWFYAPEEEPPAETPAAGESSPG